MVFRRRYLAWNRESAGSHPDGQAELQAPQFIHRKTFSSFREIMISGAPQVRNKVHASAHAPQDVQQSRKYSRSHPAPREFRRFLFPGAFIIRAVILFAPAFFVPFF